MSDEEFKALLDWYCRSGNWDGWHSMSTEDCDAINRLIDRESENRGFENCFRAHQQLTATV